MSESSILDPSALVSALSGYLPPSSRSLRSPQDAIAALVHTTLSALAFRLVAVNDHDASSTAYRRQRSSQRMESARTRQLYFRYKHDQSSLSFIVKLSKLGSRTMINAIAAETDKAESLDISTTDFTSESFFPWSASDSATSPLVHGFISSNRISDLVSQLKLKIIQKLMPGLRKEGYTEDVTSTNSTAASQPSTSNQTQPGQAPPGGSQPRPYNPYSPSPVFPDSAPGFPSGRNPLEIGRSDLDPFPGEPRLGRNAFAPPQLFPGAGGDGMFVGPDHPLFQGGGVGGNGPWGGDGFLPPMGAPPGARFDPVNPLGGPGLGPFAPGGRAPRQQGDPDNDEFMPPGMGDMYM
ncbi:PI31 proteasome regulator N-terminal-domain-containing protein [Flagelloscypha sp. PMI_526]|nr:PI31 proteasome regulator N-terminal-domain-containing protein [Flagelloscypha sp. PMI_526]